MATCRNIIYTVLLNVVTNTKITQIIGVHMCEYVFQKYSLNKDFMQFHIKNDPLWP